MGEVIRYQAVVRLTLCVIDIAYCVYLIPPPLNGTASGATTEYLNRFSVQSLTPGILRHAVGATARLMRRGAAYHRPAALQAAISHSGDGPRPLPYRALEPRGGIEPPHVRDVTGRRFRFCYCTRHMWRIPSLHAPPGAAALQVSAHSVAVIVPPLPPP